MSAPPLARLALGVLSLFHASSTLAQSTTVGDIDGKSQLQLQTSLIDYSRLTSMVDDVEGAPETKATGVQFGIASRLGLAYGYGFSNHVQMHLLAGFSVR